MIILLLWKVLFSLRWSVQVGSYTTVISIDVITEGVETLKGFRGPLTAEIAADLKWLHISVEESYMTKVICDSFTTKFKARWTVKQTHVQIVALLVRMCTRIRVALLWAEQVHACARAAIECHI